MFTLLCCHSFIVSSARPTVFTFTLSGGLRSDSLTVDQDSVLPTQLGPTSSRALELRSVSAVFVLPDGPGAWNSISETNFFRGDLWTFPTSVRRASIGSANSDGSDIIRRSLDAESVSALVHAFVTSRHAWTTDYCNAVLTGAPKFTVEKLQCVPNAAARLVIGTRKFDLAWNVFFMTTCTGSTFPNEFSSSSV